MDLRSVFLILCAAAMSGCPDVAQISAADPQDPSGGPVLEIRYRDASSPQPAGLAYPQPASKF